MENTFNSEGTQPPPYTWSQTEGTPLAPETNVIQSFIISEMGPHPMSIKCPSCRYSITTRVDVVPSTQTHLIAAIICFLGGICGCCCIPYCVDSCQNSNHYCTNCNVFIGSYNSK